MAPNLSQQPVQRRSDRGLSVITAELQPRVPRLLRLCALLLLALDGGALERPVPLGAEKGRDGIFAARRELLQAAAGEVPSSSCSETTACGRYVFEAGVQGLVGSTACSDNTGLGVQSCGDLLLDPAALSALRTGSCAPGQGTCSSNATGEAHYWRVGEWSPCPATCGDGIQERRVECVESATGIILASSRCPQQRPPFQRRCNQLPCELQRLHFRAVEAPPKECSKPCGGGWQEKHSLCAIPDGLLADPSLCATPSAVAELLPCNSQPCGQYRWELGPWTMCNASCSLSWTHGGGHMTRSVRCFDDENNEVSVDLCPGEEPGERRCNTQPCRPQGWYTAPWLPECSAEGCSVGEQQREDLYSDCQDSGGNIGGAHRCTTPGAKGTAPCRNLTESCQQCDHDCHGNGQCMVGGACRCNPGWRGRLCEISLNDCPVGLLDGEGSCCPSGMVDRLGGCCPTANATLNWRGDCCNSGVLDAAGECDGDALYVDIGRRKCNKGPPDAQGVSCENGEVDECGVCNGYGASCALRVSVQLLLDGASAGGHQVSRFALEEFMAAALSLNPRQVSAESIEEITRSQEGLRVVFVVSPPPMPRAGEPVSESPAAQRYPVPSTGSAHQRLQLIQGRLSATGAFFLNEVLSVVRAPVCGNGVCEIGERPVTGANGFETSCKADCGHVYTACPGQSGLDGADAPCGGRGICYNILGQCGCFEGHRGAACEECIPGWVMHRSAGGGNVCVRQSEKRSRSRSGTLTAGFTMVLIPLGVGGTFAVFVIVGFTLITKSRAGGLRRRESSAPEELQSPGTSGCRPNEDPASPSSSNPPSLSSVSLSESAKRSARQLDSIVYQQNISLSDMLRLSAKAPSNPSISRIANNLLGQASLSRDMERDKVFSAKVRGIKKSVSSDTISALDSKVCNSPGSSVGAPASKSSPGSHARIQRAADGSNSDKNLSRFAKSWDEIAQDTFDGPGRSTRRPGKEPAIPDRHERYVPGAVNFAVPEIFQGNLETGVEMTAVRHRPPQRTLSPLGSHAPNRRPMRLSLQHEDLIPPIPREILSKQRWSSGSDGLPDNAALSPLWERLHRPPKGSLSGRLNALREPGSPSVPEAGVSKKDAASKLGAADSGNPSEAGAPP